MKPSSNLKKQQSQGSQRTGAEALKKYAIWLLYAVFVYCSYRLVRNSLLYSDMSLTTGFLRYKSLQTLHNEIWQNAFFTHALLSMLVLLAGITQFSGVLFKRHPLVHRWVGRMYCFNIICVVGPAGFIMALYANGGVNGRWAFSTLAVLWWFTTFMGYLAARKKDFLAHRNWMIYSFALTLSAVTFRMWLKFFYMLDGPPTPGVNSLYAWAAWLGFMPNLLLAYAINSRINRRRNSAWSLGFLVGR